MGGTFMVTVSPEKRTKGITYLGGPPSGQPSGEVFTIWPFIWPSIYGLCSGLYEAEMAAAGALDWGDWSSGNSGTKRWSGEYYWIYDGLGGFPWQPCVHARADCSLIDVQFRYNVPSAPAGCTLKFAYLIETLALDGVGASRMVMVGPTLGSYFSYSGSYTPGCNPDAGSWVEPWWPMDYPLPKRCSINFGDGDWTLSVSDLVLVYEYAVNPFEPACDPITAINITDTSSQLSSPASGSWIYGTAPASFNVACTFQQSGNTVTANGHGLAAGAAVMFSGSLPSPIQPNSVYYVVNPTTNTFQLSTVAGGTVIPFSKDGSGSLAQVTANSSSDGVLTSLTQDTWYWFRQPGICSKTFWFKTHKTDNWSAYIKTLPATEVWATGATIHGELDYQGDSNPYLYLGFQWGLDSGKIANEHIYWLYSGIFRTGKYPIQMTIAGLYPDRTYYFRACLHVGTPPMSANNYFGATMSFGGPVSIFGKGREFVTAKKITDDVAKLGAGRYYMTTDGNLQYESAKHREA